MNKRKYSPPRAGQALEIALETDFLQGASAIGTVLATGQGVEEFSSAEAWEDVAWD